MSSEFRLTKDQIHEILTAYREADKPTTPTKPRHEMLNPDFWFMVATFVCLLAVANSNTPKAYIELFWLGAMACIVAAMIFNIARDKVIVEDKSKRARVVIAPVRTNGVSALRQAQIDAGLAVVKELKTGEMRPRNVH